MANKLTPKQENFVQGLFSGLSQREAYKRAYNTEKWKDSSIDEKAYQLSKNVQIMSRLTELQNEIKERNMVTYDRILAEYAKIGFADIKDFLEFKTDKSIVEIYGESVTDYRMVVDVKDSSEVDGTLINEISIGKDGTFKFKLHDKMNALEKMGKTLGMFKDKVELGGSLGVTIVDDVK